MKKQLLIFAYRTYFNTLAWIAPAKAGRDSFTLFFRPRRRPVKPHHMEFLNTSEKFTIDYDGKKVQGYQWGTGDKKILLVHGWESHSYWWKSIVSTLSKEKYTIISIDAPGHGLSDGSYNSIPYYSGLIEKIVLAHGNIFAILGHSMGAMSAVYTMHRASHLSVSKLVLLAAPGEAKEWMNYFQKLMGLSDKVMQEMAKVIIAKIGHPVDYFSLKKFAETLTLSGLIIHDTDDKEAPYRHALAAHQHWPNSEMITTNGLGHNLKSTELIKNVEGFLEQEILVEALGQPA